MVERALWVRMRGDAQLSELVGARIFHDMARQNTAFPYIVMHRISTDHDDLMDGRGTLARARVQIDCYDDDSAGAWNVCEAVRLCLLVSGWTAGSINVTHCVLLDTRDLTEPSFTGNDTPAFRKSADYAVWFYEPVAA